MLLRSAAEAHERVVLSGRKLIAFILLHTPLAPPSDTHAEVTRQ